MKLHTLFLLTACFSACTNALDHRGDRDAKIESSLQVKQSVDQLLSQALAASPPIESGRFRENDLVELNQLDPNIKLDIRYATSNNFMGFPLYKQARAFLQRPAALSLLRVHQALALQGYGLLIHDAYRPWYVTKMFWDASPEDQRIYVANPAEGSVHNRGCAVDLSIYELNTGKAVVMPSDYDEPTERSSIHYTGGTDQQRQLRDLLKQAMAAEGFAVYEFEWWHFDYRGWKEYGIQNTRFEDLGKKQN